MKALMPCLWKQTKTIARRKWNLWTTNHSCLGFPKEGNLITYCLSKNFHDCLPCLLSKISLQLLLLEPPNHFLFVVASFGHMLKYTLKSFDVPQLTFLYYQIYLMYNITSVSSLLHSDLTFAHIMKWSPP